MTHDSYKSQVYYEQIFHCIIYNIMIRQMKTESINIRKIGLSLITELAEDN